MFVDNMYDLGLCCWLCVSHTCALLPSCTCFKLISERKKEAKARQLKRRVEPYFASLFASALFALMSLALLSFACATWHQPNLETS